MNDHRWALKAGVVLTVSGLIHALIWTITGQTWEGALSIRKPILFGVSTGLTLISLGWIQQKLRPARYDAVINPLFAAALLIEVGLISMQYWRGEASHFNHGTAFDHSVDRVMTWLIVFAAFVILDLSRRSFSFLKTSREMQLAIRAGLAFLVISCGLGFFILFYGEHLVSLNRSPEKFGKAGVLKFPHGVVIHAIQFLPLFVWGMNKLGISSEKRFRLLKLAIAAMATFLIFSLLQTFSGRARHDVGWVSGFTLIIALLLILPILKELVFATLGKVRRKDRPPLQSV